MSRRVVRYDKGKPIYEDEGPGVARKVQPGNVNAWWFDVLTKDDGKRPEPEKR
jgi:hypothetical protein